MKIENFRKQEFKNKVNYIMNSRGHKSAIIYNFNIRGETKRIKINGVEIENCIAYYRIDGVYFSISYSDLLKLERKLKLSKLKGEEVKIKSIAPCIILNVGEYYVLSSLFSTRVIKIIGKTAKQFKYVYCNYTLPVSESNKRENFMKQLDYNINCQLNEIVINSEKSEINILRLDRFGGWINKNAWISGNGKTYSEIHIAN